MPDDIAERFMRDLPKTLAKIAAYRKGVANLDAKLRTLPLQSLGPDDVKTMFEALFRVASDGLTMAEQAIGRLQAERNEAQATVAKLTREIAQAKEPVAELIADRCVVRRGRLGTVGRAVSCPSGGCFVAGLCASSARFCALDGVPV